MYDPKSVHLATGYCQNKEMHNVSNLFFLHVSTTSAVEIFLIFNRYAFFQGCLEIPIDDVLTKLSSLENCQDDLKTFSANCFLIMKVEWRV